MVTKKSKSKGNAVLSYVKQLTNTNKLKIQDSVKTLISNTGLKMQSLYVHSEKYVEQFFEIEDKPPEFFCDWLTFAGNNVSEDNFNTLLSEVMIGGYWGHNLDCEQYDSNVALFRGGAKFNHVYKNLLGAKLKVRIIEDESGNKYQLLLSLSGKVLEQLFKRNDMHSIAKFVSFCVHSGLHITRIDLSIDDYQKKLKILDVKNWTEQGNFQGFQTFSIHQSGGKVKKSPKSKITGLTVVCGSRESDKSVRIYDTFVKHKKKAIRVEGEFKDKKAKAIQDYFLDYCERINCIHAIEEEKKQLLLWCKNILLSGITFCDREKAKRVGTKIEYKVYEQWTNWINYLSEKFEKIKLVVCQKVLTVRDKWEFLNKQVKGTLSLITKGLSKENLLKLIDLLLALDENKQRPEIINKDRQLLIASMQRKGISAIFNENELQNIYDEYGIEFHSQSSYYLPIIKEDAMTANKKILRSLLKDKELDKDNEQRLFSELNDPLAQNNYHQKQDNNLYEQLLNNFNVIEFLVNNFPSVLGRIMDNLEYEQKSNIIEYLEYLGLGINGVCSTVTSASNKTLNNVTKY